MDNGNELEKGKAHCRALEQAMLLVFSLCHLNCKQLGGGAIQENFGCVCLVNKKTFL